MGELLENEILNIIREQNSLIEVINMFIEFENTIPNNKSSLKDPNVLCTPLKLVKIIFNKY